MKRKRKFKWKHFVGIIRWGIILIPANIAKLFNKNIWLVEEDDNEARDNGYWLFKYIRENHPEQKCFYVINKKSPDYEKVKILGKTIKPHSLKHWFWYIVAKKNITTQTGGKPCPAFVNLMEKKGVFKTKTYFLQHGVIYNNLKWLYNSEVKFKMFLTSAKPEYNYVVKNFGHPKEIVKMLGLPRFDNLHENVVDENMILVMPSWRNYINNAGAIINENAQAQNFLDSEYFKGWNDFLNNKELDNFLTKNNKKILFYPHRNMQPFLKHFTTNSENITMASVINHDLQTLLKTCSVLITDYSSVFFDVLYQKKPVICYQFDEESFRKGQYEQGYLDFHKTNLLMQSNNIDGILKHLETINKNNYKISKKTNDEIDEFFTLHDNNNCKRVYEYIKSN